MTGIIIENISKRYGDALAVNNVSFSVTSGAVHGLLGPNGAGKTTLMKIISGILSPTSGDVKVGEFSILNSLNQIKSKIGFLPETPPVYLDMRVLDYLNFVAEIHGKRKNEIGVLLDRAIDKCGLSTVSKRLIGNLSKGYRQRVGIAQALVHNPEYLILDEPTVGLDPSSIVEIRNLINELKTDHTIILSSHQLHEIGLTCSEITVINKGLIVQSGPLDEIERKLSGERIFIVELERWRAQDEEDIQKIDFLNSVHISSKCDTFIRLKIGIKDNNIINNKSEITKWLVERNLGLQSFTEEKLELEGLFFKLTSQEG